jgi:hypothetical protein
MHVLMGQLVELVLVSLKLGDEVHEMLGFLEFIQVLCVDHVPELVLDLDDKLDHVEAVKAVLCELGVECDLRFLGGAEVVLDDAEHILLDLVVVLEHESVLLALGLLLPEGDVTSAAAEGDLGGLLGLEAESVEEGALGQADYHGAVHKEGGDTSSHRHLSHELGKHFSF